MARGDLRDARLKYFSEPSWHWPRGFSISLGKGRSGGQVFFPLRVIFFYPFSVVRSPLGSNELFLQQRGFISHACHLMQLCRFQEFVPWCTPINWICSSVGNRTLFQGVCSKGRLEICPILRKIPQSPSYTTKLARESLDLSNVVRKFIH